MNQKISEIQWYSKIGDFVIINHNMYRKLGVIQATILAELINQESKLLGKNKIAVGQPFYFTHNLIKFRTSICRDSQIRAFNRLSKIGLISYETVRGFSSPRNYFTLNRKNIEDLIKSNITVDEDIEPIQQIPHIVALNNGEIVAHSDDRIVAHSDDSIIDVEESIVDKEESTDVPSEHLLTSSLMEPQTGSMVNDGNLRLTTNLIRRKITTPIEFEKSPRLRYRKDVIDIITYWNNSIGLRHHRTPFDGSTKSTTTFENIVSKIENVLNGKFFIMEGLTEYAKIYTKEEIISIIDRFKLATTNSRYFPKDKSAIKTTGLDTFFRNPRSGHSYFLKYLEEEPKLITNYVKREEEKNPQLTIWLREVYLDKILLGCGHIFNNIEENHFIKGANVLHHTMRHLQRRLNMTTRPQEWCNIVLDCLVDNWGRDKIKPGHISSDYTYSEILPRYLKNRGRID